MDVPGLMKANRLLMKRALRDINAMDREEFTDLLGGVFEHAPWVAAQTWTRAPFSSVADLHACMLRVVDYAPPERVMQLIRAHSDRASRPGGEEEAVIFGEEQEEQAQLAQLRAQYASRFGFPFIIADRGREAGDILAALKSRIGNSPVEERREALGQIARIAAFRLSDLIADTPKGN